MMKRIKVKLIGSGKPHDPFRVDLPTYVIDCARDAEGNPVFVDKTHGIIKDGVDYEQCTCYVLVPDDEADEVAGKVKLKQKRIKEKYKEHWSKFEAEDVEAE